MDLPVFAAIFPVTLRFNPRKGFIDALISLLYEKPYQQDAVRI